MAVAAAWEGSDDPQKPSNWSFLRKWTIVVTTSSLSFVVSFGSSNFVTTLDGYSTALHVSKELMLLGVSFYVIGLGLGPLLWGPLSERFGRTRPLWFGMVAYCLLYVPLSAIENAATVLTLRLLAGLVGSSALGIVAGMYVDFLGPIERGVSTGIYSAATFCGPALGPIIGSVVADGPGWRWVSWITLIMAVSLTAICYLCTPETSEKILLRRKAKQSQDTAPPSLLQCEKGTIAPSSRLTASGVDTRCESSFSVEVEEPPSRGEEFATIYLRKPIRMFVAEPILVFMTTYMTLAYGILYLTFVLYPKAFTDVRGWSSTTASMPFLSILAGALVSCLIISIHSIYFIGKRTQAGTQLMPEDRLPPIIIGSFLLPIGLFWFSWTSSPEISWIPQVVSGAFIGCGIVLVIMSSILYLVEVYLLHINSAMAINNLIRCVTAAFFPQAGVIMLRNLGVEWAGTVLGCICVTMAIFPIILYGYGPKIRSWSKFSM